MHQHQRTKAGGPQVNKISGRPTHPLTRQLVVGAIWMAALGSVYGWVHWMPSSVRPVQGAKVKEAFVLPAKSTDAVAALLGASPPAVPMSRRNIDVRFVVAGVIAAVSGNGVALIAVDGKPARPYAIGAELAPGYVLHSVLRNQVMLAESPQSPISAVLAVAENRLVVEKTVEAMTSRALQNVAMRDMKPTQLAAAPDLSAGPPARQDSRYQVPVLRRH